MALRTDIIEEKIALEAIARGSIFGKNIVGAVLNPILNSVQAEFSNILNDLGFMIVSEIQHRLATAPAGNTYKVYMVDESVSGKGRYTFIGYYTASAESGPPMSGELTESGLPTGSLYESIYYEVDREGILSVTIDSPQGTERNYYFQPGKGVIVGFSSLSHPTLPVHEYFQILNNLDGTRPNWWGRIIDRKKKYWYDWMKGRFQKAVAGSVRKFLVRKALKVNIYWETN